MKDELAPRKNFDELVLLRAWNEGNSKSLVDYCEAILRLPPEERTKDRGASWGSIQDIFLHVIEDYIWWYDNVPQGRAEDALYPQFVGKGFSDNELRQLVQKVTRTARSFLESLTPEDLGRPYEVHGTYNGKPYTMTTCPADIVWHMVEEQLQHIGELNALFWQMNIDPHSHSWFSNEAAWTH